MDRAGSTPSSIDDWLERFVRDVSRIADDDPDFNRTVDLFDSGYLDSLGIVALTAFIEQTFGIDLAEEEMFDPRFTTVDGITEIIASRRAVSTPGRTVGRTG